MLRSLDQLVTELCTGDRPRPCPTDASTRPAISAPVAGAAVIAQLLGVGRVIPRDHERDPGSTAADDLRHGRTAVVASPPRRRRCDPGRRRRSGAWIADNPPMPRLSSFYGIVIWMCRPDHPPPHLHAQYDEHIAQIELGTPRVLSGSLRARALRLVREWAPPRRRTRTELGARASRSSRWSRSTRSRSI